MTTNELIAVAHFLGDEITDTQVNRLMDEVRQSVSIADREVILSCLDGNDFYTALRENERELGGYSRY